MKIILFTFYIHFSQSEDENVQKDLLFSAIQFCETSPRVVTVWQVLQTSFYWLDVMSNNIFFIFYL